MRHARTDYDRIQDPAGIIPEDEPVFLIRGQDAIGPSILRDYAERAACRKVDPVLIDAVLAHAERMDDWQKTHVKIPDMPEDAVLRD